MNRSPLASKLAGSLLALLLVVAGSPLAHAGEGHPTWCEVEVDLLKNGRATVTYAVCYEVTVPELHGFYFSGPQIDSLNPVWDDGWGRATVLATGHEIPIVRGVRGGRQTIEFGGGEGVAAGRVVFKFRFATDFAKTGHLAKTTAADGEELAVFHWAPSTWDHALEHYTITVRYPESPRGSRPPAS